jgi:hypothetical protein
MFSKCRGISWLAEEIPVTTSKKTASTTVANFHQDLCQNLTDRTEFKKGELHKKRRLEQQHYI